MTFRLLAHIGDFGTVKEDISIFQELSVAAPNSSFEGCIDGFNMDGDDGVVAEYKSGKLSLNFELPSDDDDQVDECNTKKLVTDSNYDISPDRMTLFTIGQVKGKKEEVANFLSVLKKYEEGGDEFTIRNVNLNPKSVYSFTGNVKLKSLSAAELDAYVESSGKRKKTTFFSFSILVAGKGLLKRMQLPFSLSKVASGSSFFFGGNGTNEAGYQEFDVTFDKKTLTYQYRTQAINVERNDWDIDEQYTIK